ncbi:MAG TPA: copper homeostasis protein CutC [Saprospiraceae bacterium]|nr:copper homeostasis protein CutC [Saprospiraceae bacterium]
MLHRNAPLSVEGRRRLVERCQTRPLSHVAAEMGISRACASKWMARYREHGELGLLDRPSVPHHQPTATPAETVTRIETLRRSRKWSAARIAHELGADGIVSGALLPDGNIDLARIRLMLEAAEGLPFTFHRAFDMCRDPLRAIDELAELGVQRILSSGQQPNAALGFEHLRRFAQYAAGRLSIMACGSLMPDNVGPLTEVPEIQEFHAAVRGVVRSEMQYRGAINMGDESADEEFNWMETDVSLVAGLKRGIAG